MVIEMSLLITYMYFPFTYASPLHVPAPYMYLTLLLAEFSRSISYMYFPLLFLQSFLDLYLATEPDLNGEEVRVQTP